MKHLIFGFMCLLLTNNGYAQTVISYGKHKVQLSELMQAYNKNRSQGEDEIPLKEYVSMYADFKLKVQAAKDIRLDTLLSIQQDVLNFRSQMVEQYMNDEASTKKLLQEAIDRSKTDRSIAYFFAPHPTTDSLAGIEAMQKVYTALAQDRTDFQNIAQQSSSQHTKVSYIDAGYVTVFSLPYSLEQVVYGLQPGETSKPFQTTSGTHVIKVLKERPHFGKWKIAQILISLPAPSTGAQELNAAYKARELYKRIQHGEDFGKLAAEYSDDKFSFSTQGELSEFSTGKFTPHFEEQVLLLKENGQVAQPFQTSMGYHIIKRLQHTSVNDYSEGEWKALIHDKLMKDARLNISRAIFNKQIEKQTGFRVLNTVSLSTLMVWADSVKGTTEKSKFNQFKEVNKPLIKLNDRTLPVSDWLTYVQNYSTNYALYKGESSAAMWDKFKEASVRNYYKDHLEKFNIDFKFQMQEFLEGNMLFEIMEKKVWGKAIADTVGLEKFYNKHTTRYVWEPSADMILFHVTDVNEAEIIRKKLTAGMERSMIEAQHPYILTDSGRFETSQLFDPTFTPAPKAISSFKMQQDGTVTFVYVIRLHPPGQQKSFTEARGLVINDYQDLLEEQWLAELKKKYPIKINASALKE